MRQSEAIAILKEAYQCCQEMFPTDVQGVYLYGSYARGDYDNESDVDILLTVAIEPMQLVSYRNRIASISSDLSLAHDVMVSITVKPFEQFRQPVCCHTIKVYCVRAFAVLDEERKALSYLAD